MEGRKNTILRESWVLGKIMRGKYRVLASDYTILLLLRLGIGGVARWKESFVGVGNFGFVGVV